MDVSQLCDLRIRQTMVDNGAVFQDREFRKNILGVEKGKKNIVSIIFIWRRYRSSR